jgi:hypothetical protein
MTSTIFEILKMNYSMVWYIGNIGKNINNISWNMKCLLGIFTIRVPFLGHKYQGICFCYLPNIESTWNKFKYENLHKSNCDNSYSNGDFSHAYVIKHQYFGLKREM